MNYSQVAEGSANTALPSDAEILEYEQRIREDEAKQHPLVGKRLPLRQLMDKEFADNPPFLGKLQSLIDRHYTSYRSCRGDGNCFYRAFAFSLFEQLLLNPGDRRMALAKHLLNECLTSHCTMLQAAGFNSMSYEDFQEPFVNLLRLIAGDDPVVVESEGLRVMLAGDGENGQADDLTTLMTFNAIVVYLRFFCSAYLKCNRELYEAFVADVGGLDSYCERSIEAMDKEADELCIIAVVNGMRLNVDVAYLDAHGGSDQQATIHHFKPQQATGGEEISEELLLQITLLYRPGHYDILYRD